MSEGQKKLTKQDVFDIVWPWANNPLLERAFVTDWDLRNDEDLCALGIDEGCQYDDRKGNNCAIGVCLKGRVPPDHPVWTLQGSVNSIDDVHEELLDEVFDMGTGRERVNMLTFLGEVQTAHDSSNTDEHGAEVSADAFDVEAWRAELPGRLREIADRWALEVPA